MQPLLAGLVSLLLVKSDDFLGSVKLKGTVGANVEVEPDGISHLSGMEVYRVANVLIGDVITSLQ